MAWEEWLEEHMKTCQTCRDAFRGTCEAGMCEIAFEKFKEYLKEAANT
jgi:predicted anti-sigma-YlaC factor YlaD